MSIRKLTPSLIVVAIISVVAGKYLTSASSKPPKMPYPLA